MRRARPVESRAAPCSPETIRRSPPARKLQLTAPMSTLSSSLSTRPLAGVKKAIGRESASRLTGRADVLRGANKTHGRTSIVGAMRYPSN